MHRVAVFVAAQNNFVTHDFSSAETCNKFASITYYTAFARYYHAGRFALQFLGDGGDQFVQPLAGHGGNQEHVTAQFFG